MDLPLPDQKAVPERHHAPLVKYLIDRLAENLLRLETRYPQRLAVADTRGIIDPVNGWQNEIHPESGGFRKLARIIYRTLDAQRV